jgi:hypothetical protein
MFQNSNKKDPEELRFMCDQKIHPGLLIFTQNPSLPINFCHLKALLELCGQSSIPGHDFQRPFQANKPRFESPLKFNLYDPKSFSPC